MFNNNIEYSKHCVENFTRLAVKSLLIAIIMLLVLFIILHALSLYLLRKIQFYQCCLDLLNNE